jgi:hypothetical protein
MGIDARMPGDFPGRSAKRRTTARVADSKPASQRKQTTDEAVRERKMRRAEG